MWRFVIALFTASLLTAQISHSGTQWTIRGHNTHVVHFDQSNFVLTVQSGPVTWTMLPSSSNDLTVASGGDVLHFKLTDAGNIQIAPYETGFKSGIRIILDHFRFLDLRLVLTLCLEGPDDDLVAEVVVNERNVTVKELDWPESIDGRQVDYTLVSSDDGTMVPRDWPKAYHPVQRAKGDESVIQSHVIESWSMSWWGFLKGSSGMMVIVETPDDAGYTFSHPAGGPTTMGPVWRAQLDHFGYLRSLRMCFLPKGGYVDLAKRYRRYAMDSGLFVSLKDKIADRPIVKNLIGNPVAGMRVLRNLKPDSARYDPKNPSANYQLATFAQNIQRLRELKAAGFEHANVSLSGWLKEGYDRQTPDALPPPEAAGGWAGMKAYFDACKEIGFTCWLHDQYRDYYLDAPSWNPDFAVHEEDAVSPPKAFPGTRFKHDWKDGSIPLMNYWDGGTQGYLNSRFMLGFVVRNYQMMFAHGIHPQGSYQDVFGYIPPDQDFNPNHPNTRTDSMNYRAGVFRWVKNNLGIVGTEDGSDWVIPYVDYVTSRMNRAASTGTDPDHEDAIQVPLYELVYHDALVTCYSPNDLRGLLHASAPEWYGGRQVNYDNVKRMTALHARVGLLEMTNHEFLDKGRTKERTTFADGTTVTVDWSKNSVEIRP
jgi:hypothetical protein